MKKYADKGRSKRILTFTLGQSVLIVNRKEGKMKPRWQRDVYTVIGQKGTQLKLKETK